MKILLLYFPDCPNAPGAREALRRALAACGLPIRFEEVDVTAPGTPEPLREWGSPTILVDGRDVGGEPGPTGASCRLYPGDSGAQGVPTEDAIRLALDRARPPAAGPRAWAQSLALVPGAALSLLPSATCPACLAAYGGLLSAIGLGFLHDERVLGPLIAAFLAAGVLGAAWSRRSHGRAGPLVVTIAGSAAVIAGRLAWDVPAALYAGIALLVGAALWNLWLKRPRREPEPACSCES